MFLDRDGTINLPPVAGQYIRESNELTLLPGAAKAVRAINDANLLAIVVSNQRWLASSAAPFQEIQAVHDRLRTLLHDADDAHLDACYICPHQLEACACRKPAPGMLLRAGSDLRVDLGKSIVIGDSLTDVAAGRAAGVRWALLISSEASPSASDLTFTSLLEAVEWAL